jgi:hypothetical protein
MASNIKRMCDAGILLEKSKDIFGVSDETLLEIEERL